MMDGFNVRFESSPVAAGNVTRRIRTIISEEEHRILQDLLRLKQYPQIFIFVFKRIQIIIRKHFVIGICENHRAMLSLRF